jgi:SAM-dependent methyltransferase
MDLSELSAAEAALAVAMGEPLGSVERPAKALKEIRRILRPGGVLVATFDNKLAAIDHYLEAGRVEDLEAFLKTGRTHWLTRDQAERFELHTFTPAELAALFERAKFEVLELVGKTVLPMRHHRELLGDSATARKLARLEKRLHHDPAALGRCAHLQIAARKV